MKHKQTKSPKPISGIMDIAAYVVGKSSVKNMAKKNIIKLSSNETPLGTPKTAKQAYSKIVKNLHEYPNGDCQMLRQAIAKTYKLKANNIVCGSGSDELLALLAKAYLTKGDQAIYSQHGFLMYKINILASGAKPIMAKEKNYTTDIDEIIKHINKKTKMIFIANPNNPTGTYLSNTEIKKLHSQLPPNVLLVLDCAYGEYMSVKNYDCGTKLVEQYKNVVMTRTFSKIYGLASLRVGWAYAPPDIVDVLHRSRGPFNVNAAAIAAATAAVKDKKHIAKAVKHNEKWRKWVSEKLQLIGLKIIPSFGNFVLMQFANEKQAKQANNYLLGKGIILRYLGEYGFNNALRMTIGTAQENKKTIKLLKEFLHE